MNWDLFVMLLAFWNCISIPFTVAFEPGSSLGYSIVERFIDVCFGLDILFNLRTTYVNEKTGLEVADQKRILVNYLSTGRFFIDLAASLPFEKIIEAFKGSSQSKKLKLFGLLKLVRLLRLGRIIRYLKFRQGFKLGIRLL